MEVVSQIMAIGILATMGMTMFSYVVSYFSHSKFEEPQLINTLLDRMPDNNLHIAREHVLGWMFHVLIGMFFVAIFKMCLLLSFLQLTLVSGILFGLIAGCIGVVWWHLTFVFHPDPPKIDKLTYYIQLVVAHIIFGICTVCLFSL